MKSLAKSRKVQINYASYPPMTDEVLAKIEQNYIDGKPLGTDAEYLLAELRRLR